MLEELLAADGAVVSAETLLCRVWDDEANPFTQAVKTTMSRLRGKLGDPPDHRDGREGRVSHPRMTMMTSEDLKARFLSASADRDGRPCAPCAALRSHVPGLRRGAAGGDLHARLARDHRRRGHRTLRRLHSRAVSSTRVPRVARHCRAHVEDAEGAASGSPASSSRPPVRSSCGSRKSSSGSKSCTGWRSSPRSRSESWRSCRRCWAGSPPAGCCALCERSPRPPGRSPPPAWTNALRSMAPRTNSRTSATQSTRSWPARGLVHGAAGVCRQRLA